MILTQEVKIYLTPNTIKYYLNMGYIGKTRDCITVKIEDLPKGSNYEIEVACDICEKIRFSTYYTYNTITKNNTCQYTCPKCSVSKREKTNMLKYGFKQPTKNISVKNKIINTRNETPNYYKTTTEKCDITRQKNLEIKRSNLDITKWENYKKLSRSYFKQSKKIIYENWNGYDYYDNEYIKPYLNLNTQDMKHPTVDHIISVKKGFELGISPKEINDVKNLVVTKRYINISKGSKIFEVDKINNFNLNDSDSILNIVENRRVDTWEITFSTGIIKNVTNLSEYCKNNGYKLYSLNAIRDNRIKKHLDIIKVVNITNNHIKNK